MQDCELYHFGIKGMKWGVRRFQNTNGSLTAAGRKRNKIASPVQVAKSIKSSSKKLSPQARDTLMFGKRGAERIAERREKGKSRKQAVNIERARQITEGLLASAAISTTSYLITSGKGAELVSKGTKAVNDLMNSRFDSMILDASGKVLKRYKGSVKDVVTDLAIRR